MRGRSRWPWLLVVVGLGSCGSPGQSHQILKLDGGDEPADEPDALGTTPPDAPLKYDSAPDAPGLEATAPSPDVKPVLDGAGTEALSPDVMPAPGACGGLGQPCCTSGNGCQSNLS